MRKILSLLGTLVVSSTTTLTLISCNHNNKNNNEKDDQSSTKELIDQYVALIKRDLQQAYPPLVLFDEKFNEIKHKYEVTDDYKEYLKPRVKSLNGKINKADNTAVDLIFKFNNPYNYEGNDTYTTTLTKCVNNKDPNDPLYDFPPLSWNGDKITISDVAMFILQHFDAEAQKDAVNEEKRFIDNFTNALNMNNLSVKKDHFVFDLAFKVAGHQEAINYSYDNQVTQKDNNQEYNIGDFSLVDVNVWHYKKTSGRNLFFQSRINFTVINENKKMHN
ncbi:hypothetical protein [Spiroplasma endosymbiont of Crioceris asparagi]|uniref:hypothetical protein n=1 Tax=Spiroplasma endosymbiont of Crioceris asparagi TaxID=3066286 RepID=UPI0030CC3A5C